MTWYWRFMHKRLVELGVGGDSRRIAFDSCRYCNIPGMNVYCMVATTVFHYTYRPTGGTIQLHLTACNIGTWHRLPPRRHHLVPRWASCAATATTATATSPYACSRAALLSTGGLPSR